MIAAVGYADGLLLLVRIEDGAEILAKKPGAAPVTALGWRSDGAVLAFGTEAGGYAADGIPSVVVGPGSIDQAHKADEFIAVSELEKCGVFIDRLIDHCSA